MFERAHHRRIAQVLHALDADALRSLGCLFGGGTAIAMRWGEFRESVDIDFLVSDPAGYRRLRELLSEGAGIDSILRADVARIAVARETRVDQYGIRTALMVDDVRIKFEIVREARVELEKPGRNDRVCGVATLSVNDLAVSKLLANSDRWRDDSVFSRDAIDLAMMDLPPRRLRIAIDKARQAYGDAASRDMLRSLETLRSRDQHLLHCIRALSITLPPAAILQKLRVLQRRVEAVGELRTGR